MLDLTTVRLEYSKVLPDQIQHKTVNGKTDKIALFSSWTLHRLQGRRMLRRLFPEDIIPPLFPDEEV